MHARSGIVVLLVLLVAPRPATCADSNDAEPLRITGPEQSLVDPAKPGGGLPPVPGVDSFEVLRACRARPDLSEGKGYTYNHHVDLAVWKGRLLLAWDSCEISEDTWPSRELYETSSDGVTWSTTPVELFPQGVSTPLRLYFFHAPNGRMLAIAGLRLNHDNTSEDRKGPLVVRQIMDDGTLASDIYTLRAPSADMQPQTPPPPMFTTSSDAGFVEACRQLVANHPFLQTQDYGLLLDPTDRMKWNDPTSKFGHDFGKAMSFFHRKDGALVGCAKRGYVTISHDDGLTWSEPVVPPSLITGNGKVWGQRTPDGRYALVYNPDRRVRVPLVAVTSDDGITFSNMRDVHDQLPPMRYPGTNKSAGPSYTRGVSEWSNDGSRADIDKNAMWLTYSVNKEDIWVTRVPVPIEPSETKAVDDDFTTGEPHAVDRWNLYCPRWSTLTAERAGLGGNDITNSLHIIDRDPVDNPAATRLFPASRQVHATIELAADQTDRGTLAIDLLTTFGGIIPVRVTLSPDSNIHLGDATVAPYTAGKWMTLKIDADVARQKLSLSIDGKPVATDVDFLARLDDTTATLDRLSFHTLDRTPKPTDDLPVDPMSYRLRRVRIATEP
jgi:hypothetical protein